VYDLGTGWLVCPRREINFPEVKSLAEDEFLGPEVQIGTREQERENLHAHVWLHTRTYDENMQRFGQAHPVLV
jgi:hypothetical protein